ncbi:MAG TPA: hypothetical protein VGK17_19965 [Propionicimonas sp.]
MPIEELLELLDELGRAHVRLTGAGVGTPERRSAWREVRRLEREPAADVLRPEADTRSRKPSAGIIL